MSVVFAVDGATGKRSAHTLNDEKRVPVARARVRARAKAKGKARQGRVRRPQENYCCLASCMHAKTDAVLWSLSETAGVNQSC